MKKKFKKYSVLFGLTALSGLMVAGTALIGSNNSQTPVVSHTIKKHNVNFVKPTMLLAGNNSVEWSLNKNASVASNWAIPYSWNVNSKNMNIDPTNFTVPYKYNGKTLQIALKYLTASWLVKNLNSSMFAGLISQALQSIFSSLNLTNDLSLANADNITINNLTVQQVANQNTSSQIYLADNNNNGTNAIQSDLSNSVKITYTLIINNAALLTLLAKENILTDYFNLNSQNNGTITINNLAIPISTTSEEFFTNNVKNNVLTVSASSLPTPLINDFYTNQAWEFNSGNIEQITSSVSDYVTNALFNTNDWINNNTNKPAVNMLNLAYSTTEQTKSNQATYTFTGTELTNETSAYFVFANGNYIVPFTGNPANSAYSFGSSQTILDSLDNYLTNKATLLPTLQLSNLNYQTNKLLYSFFINAQDLGDSIANLTPFQTLYNYFDLPYETPNYAPLTQYFQILSSNFGFVVNKPIPSIQLQSEFTKANSQISYIDMNGSENAFSVSNASAFNLEIGETNDSEFQNRFIAFTDNETGNSINSGTSYIINSNIYNQMQLATIPVGDLQNNYGYGITLPFNSFILYNLSNNYLPTTINLRSTSDIDTYGLWRKTYLQLAKDTPISTWSAYLKNLVNYQQLENAKNIYAQYYNFPLNSNVSLLYNEITLTKLKNGTVWLNLPFENKSKLNVNINGYVINANSTGTVKIQLFGYVEQFDLVWVAVGGVLVSIVVAILFAWLLTDKDRKKALTVNEYRKELDEWRNKYFSETKI